MMCSKILWCSYRLLVTRVKSKIFRNDSNKAKLHSRRYEKQILLNSLNACYNTVQNLLSCRNLFKNLKIRIYIKKTVTLPVILYEYETWSFTPRVEHRLKLFQNKVLRRIFGPKIEEAVGSWIRLHNEELHNLHASPNTIWVTKLRMMRLVGLVARMGES